MPESAPRPAAPRTAQRHRTGSHANPNSPPRWPSRLAQHLPSLDGLRGLAILWVLMHNFDILEFDAPDSTGHRSVLGLLTKESLYIGWIGVQLFFVLSGFLITRGLLATQRRSDYFHQFYRKRVLRIFPLYYLTLVAVLVVLPALGWIAAKPSVFGHGWLWVYLSNWITPFEPVSGPLPHFWSLAVEEQFYLLWPLVVWQQPLHKVWRWSLLLVLLSPVLRLALYLTGAPPEALYEFTICRMDALAVGAMLAVWERQRLDKPTSLQAHHLLAISALLFLATAVLSHGFRRLGAMPQIVGYSLLALSFVALQGWALLNDQNATERARRIPTDAPPTGWAGLAERWGGVLRWAPLRSVGRYSYAMYVFHKPLHDWVGEPLLQHWLGHTRTADWRLGLGYVLVASLFTYGVGWLSWQLIERHFLALKQPAGASERR